MTTNVIFNSVDLKGREHFVKLLFKLMTVKSYLVKSTGELLIV